METLIKYTINNISHEPHDLDDDIIYFNYGITFTEPKELIVEHYFYPYSELLKYIKKNATDFYNYLESSRNSIDGFGPCERRTMEVIGDEGINRLYELLEECLLNSEWVKGLLHLSVEKNKMNTEEQKNSAIDISKKFEELKALGMESRSATMRSRAFCELAKKEMRKVALEIYPEIADLDSKQLLNFKYIFTTEVYKMQQNIEALLREEE